MKRYQLWLWPLLWALIGGGQWWATSRLVATFEGYRAPLQQAGNPLNTQSGNTTQPLAERAVVVVLSGVGAQALNDPRNPWAFATFRRLAAEGAWGVSDAVIPSGDSSTWAALLSGAPPLVSGVVVDTSAVLNLNTIFSQARIANRSTLLVSSASALATRSRFVPNVRVAIAPSSDRVGNLAAAELGVQREGLAVVVLDLARREQYRGTELWGRVDQQLAQVVAQLDPQRDLLLVTADHGLLPNGGYGGDEPVVRQTPLVLWGKGVVPGPLGTLQQRDLAPTIALGLGLPLPAANQGRPLVEAFALPLADQAAALIRWLEQRVNLSVQSDQRQSDSPPGYWEARTAFAAGEWTTAINQAQRAVAGLDQPTSTSFLAGSEYLWAIGVPLLFLVLARLLGRQGRALARWLALPALGLELYLLAWSLIYFGLAGRDISLSSLYHAIDSSLLSIGGWAVLALVVASLPLAWLASSAPARVGATAVGNIVRLVVLLQLIGGVVAASLWLLAPSPLQQPVGWSGLVIVLAQLAGVGLATPLVAGLAAALADILQRGR